MQRGMASVRGRRHTRIREKKHKEVTRNTPKPKEHNKNKDTPQKTIKMTKKNIHSRAYHAARKRGEHDGMSSDAAKDIKLHFIVSINFFMCSSDHISMLSMYVLVLCDQKL